MRRLLVLLVILLLILGVWSGVQQYGPHISDLLKHTPIASQQTQPVKVVTEESVTISVVKNVGPSVVTVVGEGSVPQSIDLGPFSIFNIPQDNTPQQSVGSGFIVSSDGMIITNKHVVADTTEKYHIVTFDNKNYDVQRIYRDPLNDIAILKINPSQNNGNTLKPVSMGDSSHLQVGQFVVAIGTALGEFRNTVTTGVVSGLGRGITAGDEFQGEAEKLDNVIQTSAAINPGNSGGPLVDSSGQVIGINTAVAEGGQNIGFALPINAVKDSLNNFNQTGQFDRPYLGVAYKTVTQAAAILNDVPQGAYVETVISGSPADTAGIQVGDIITKFDNQQVKEGQELATLISKKKANDTISITLWRDGKIIDTTATLGTAPNQ